MVWRFGASVLTLFKFMQIRYGAQMVLNGEIEIKVVFTVFLSISEASFAVGGAVPQLSLLAVAKGAAAAVYQVSVLNRTYLQRPRPAFYPLDNHIIQVIDRTPEIDSYSRDGFVPAPNQVKGRVVLENVFFNYPSRPDVQVCQLQHDDGTVVFCCRY